MLRLLLVAVVLALVGAYLLGYWRPDVGRSVAPVTVERPVAHPDRAPVDPQAARDTAAAVGERAANAVNRAAEAFDDTALTGKIKSKMALDDLVRARNIDVDTRDGVVRLSGVVGSDAERHRAMDLARQTSGVKAVTDAMQLQPGR